MKSKFPWLKFCVSTLISLVFCVYAASNVMNECSPRCWNPVLLNAHTRDGIKQYGVASEEECKALCVNSEPCIGVDWSTELNSCWFQMKDMAVYNYTRVRHWSLANCTDECVSYCWRPVKINLHVSGGILRSNIRDENHCKLLCSKTLNCTGIDWGSNCYLLYRVALLTNDPGVRHWDIKRTFPTSCQEYISACSWQCVAFLQSSTKPLEDLQNTTYFYDDQQCSTNRADEIMTGLTDDMIAGSSSTKAFENLEEGSIGHSDPLRAGITVLAVLLGLATLIIIGLSINTVRIGRKSHPRCDIKSVEMDDAYDCLQMDDTNVISEERPYLSRPMAKMP